MVEPPGWQAAMSSRMARQIRATTKAASVFFMPVSLSCQMRISAVGQYAWRRNAGGFMPHPVSLRGVWFQPPATLDQARDDVLLTTAPLTLA